MCTSLLSGDSRMALRLAPFCRLYCLGSLTSAVAPPPLLTSGTHPAGCLSTCCQATPVLSLASSFPIPGVMYTEHARTRGFPFVLLLLHSTSLALTHQAHSLLKPHSRMSLINVRCWLKFTTSIRPSLRVGSGEVCSCTCRVESNSTRIFFTS